MRRSPRGAHLLLQVRTRALNDDLAGDFQIFDFSLSDQHIADLDACDKTGGTDRVVERKWW
jgi:2,5-diketo-D-gluconate reductase A